MSGDSRRSTSQRRASSRIASSRSDKHASTTATVARVFLPYEHLRRHAQSESLTELHLYGFTRVNDANRVDIVVGAHEHKQTEVLGRLSCGRVGGSDDTTARKNSKVWLEIDVGARWSEPPKVVVHVSSARLQFVQVIICPMPDPPLSVFALSDCDSSGDLSRALAELNRLGAAKFCCSRGTSSSQRSRRGVRTILARYVVPCVDTVLGVINYQFMHSLGSEPRWSGGFTRRSLCEIFASACVLRQRLYFIRGVLLEPLNWHNLDRLQRRRALARAFQFTFDLLLGIFITYCMIRIDVREDALKRRLVLGGSSRSSYPSESFLIGTDTIERNAEWISRGDPLGFKLHVPLAKRLGAVAVIFVHSVATTAREPAVINFMIHWFRLSILFGGVFGASMVFALLADITTTVTMHIAALHVYSSLFITAQLRLIRYLYRQYINPKKSATSFKLADEVRARTVEEVIIGTLSLPPLLLLLPTVFFYYSSYLCIHAATIAARLIMVLIASILLNFPTDIVLVRLWTPHAFPSSMRLGQTEIRGVHYVALLPTPKSMGDMLAPFNHVCFSWLYNVFRAVLRAMLTCGRFPITLVPFTLDAY